MEIYYGERLNPSLRAISLPIRGLVTSEGSSFSPESIFIATSTFASCLYPDFSSMILYCQSYDGNLAQTFLLSH
jgi:hypothetical protein